MTTYKYVGITIVENFSLKSHIDHLVRKLKLVLGFFFRNKSCFSFNARKWLVAATLLPLLDCGDVLYMNASAHSLHLLDVVYHGTLYSLVNWLSLPMRRTLHFIHKSILGLLPIYLSTYMSCKQCFHGLCSQGFIHLSISSVPTKFGKKAFSYSGTHYSRSWSYPAWFSKRILNFC